MTSDSDGNGGNQLELTSPCGEDAAPEAQQFSLEPVSSAPGYFQIKSVAEEGACLAINPNNFYQYGGVRHYSCTTEDQFLWKQVGTDTGAKFENKQLDIGTQTPGERLCLVSLTTSTSYQTRVAVCDGSWRTQQERTYSLHTLSGSQGTGISVPVGTQTVAYSYDTLGRLILVNYEDESPTNENNRTITYTYDAAGNRTRVAVTDTSSPSEGSSNDFTYEINGEEVTEGNNLNFEITRTGDISVASTVRVQTSDNDADAGLDYIAVNRPINFPANETQLSVNVETFEDTISELSESFRLSLFKDTTKSLENGDTPDAQGTGTITNYITGNPSPENMIVTLVDGATGNTVKTLSTNDTISADELTGSTYELDVVYTGSGTVRSVRFYEGDTITYKNENAAPYERFGGQYGPRPTANFPLRIRIFSERNGGGNILAEHLFNISVE